MTERARILIVDDDRAVVEFMLEALGDRYVAVGESSPQAALARIGVEEFDIVISDVEMPGLRGTDLLAAILEKKPTQLVLLITAFGSIELAVAAVRAGAVDFVAKPFKTDVLVLAIERALRDRSIRRELVQLRRRLGEDTSAGLVATSPAMKRVIDIGARAARSDATVLITGESGVGKGALARWIHDRGRRNTHAFVHVNCAALPATLVEAELFGVKRGAFTDARESRDGMFVEASGGTLFLDEIGEMALEGQAKLLQVLESSRVRPVGGTEIDIDTRLIAATNREVEEIRSDLFFRLAVIPIAIPPLRERREDIPELVHAFLSRPRGTQMPVGITDEAMRWLGKQDWPGNVRQLANVVERAVALTEHESIVIEDVRDLGMAPREVATLDLGEAAAHQLPLAEVERRYIARVVEQCDGNVSRAARILGIDRRTIYRKL